MRIPKLLVIAGVVVFSAGVFNFQSFAQVDPQKQLDKDADAQKKLNDPAYLDKLKQDGIQFTPNQTNTNAPAPAVKPDQDAKKAAADLAAKQKAEAADAKMAAKKQAAEDAAKQKAEAADAAKKKASEAEAKKKAAAERAETAKIEARLAAKQKQAAEMEAKRKAAGAKASEVKVSPGSTVAVKGATPAPIPAPALVPGSKDARLAELLQQYKADKVSPSEYHEQRAKILAEP